jgi:hypothetical protein
MSDHQFTVTRGEHSIPMWTMNNRPEKEGVYLCETEDGTKLALELTHVQFDKNLGWLPSVWCWSLPGFSSDRVLGQPYWQPGWLKSVGEFICDPLPVRVWSQSDAVNWESLTAGRRVS